MPRRYVRRRTRRKSPWYNRKYSPMQIAAKAWKGVRYLKGLVNSERMHKDFVYSGQTLTNSGLVTHLTAITQNDTIEGRTGQSLLLRNITYRGRLEVNSAVTSNTAITMIVFQDKQQVGDTSPAVTDILSAANPESLLALNTLGRFKVISRKTWVLTPASGGRPAIEINKTFNLYKHVRYNGTASSDIQKNGHYVLFISSENTNYPTFSGTFRIGYHDN